MKTWTKVRFEKAMRDGRIECLTDISRAGYVEIRHANGKRETISIK